MKKNNKKNIAKGLSVVAGCALLNCAVGANVASAVSFDSYNDYTLEEVEDLEEGLENADMDIENGNVIFKAGPKDNFYGSYTLRFDEVGVYSVSIHAYENDNGRNLEIVGLIADEEYTFLKSGDSNYYLYNINVEDADDVLTIEVRLTEDSVGDGELILGHAVTVKNAEGTDTVKPVITGNKATYKVNVSDLPTLEELFEDVTALDDVDGDVEVAVKDNGGYKAEVGEYTVVLKATDSAANESTVTTVVKVVDSSKPVVTGDTDITTNLSSLLTLEEITASLTANDNYDNNVELTVVEDNYTSNKQLVGTYTIKYEAKDSSDNTTEVTVSVTVVDDVKPVITGDSSYVIGCKNELTLDMIKANLKVSDNVDSAVELELSEDKFTSATSENNVYTVTYKAEDKYNNVAYHTVTITVKNNVPYVYFGDVTGLGVYHNKALSHDQIVNSMLDNVASYEVLNDTYSDNKVTVGTYEVEYKVTLNNGEVKTVATSVNVIEGKEEKGFFAKVWSFVVKMFKNIGEFFVKLWKSITFKKPNWKEWY